MLLQRIANASTQTDPVKTLLMRDAHLDAQPDLIGKRSASVETDGAVTITNNNLKGCMTNIFVYLFYLLNISHI